VPPNCGAHVPLRIVIGITLYALGVLFVAATLLAVASALHLDRGDTLGWFLVAACVSGSLVQVTVVKFVLPWTLGRYEAKQVGRGPT
jgi:hypothetical protein